VEFDTTMSTLTSRVKYIDKRIEELEFEEDVEELRGEM